MSKSILVVDDTRSMRAMVAAVLEGAGYEVAQAGDGVEALELARTRVFDLVVTDHNMPRMDGVTLVRELRRLSNYDAVALIVLSTEASPELKQKGREAGATGWMAKPFDPQRMLDIVGKFI
ncbi:MAG TPA: response regulator [Ramlibacter sp.]|uniref:response regulator n=1 Tax=Ramlibacter sp. TaxID=1917967 RepID=UPI002D804717|nr:response regulator [Ramlibacter sp.]HET8748840.1 response regulator [Ramlibacter sp.]